MKNEGFVQLRRGVQEHLENGRLTIPEFGFFVYLLLKADKRTGVIFKVSSSFLAVGSRQSISTVKRQISKLKKLGYLKVFREGLRYWLILDKFLCENRIKIDASKILSKQDLRDWVSQPRADFEPTLSRVWSDFDRNNNTKRLKTKESKIKKPSFDFESFLKNENNIKKYDLSESIIPLIGSFNETRTKKWGAFSEQGFKMMLTKLHRESKGNDDIKQKILENAIISEWKGIWPLNGNELKEFDSHEMKL